MQKAVCSLRLFGRLSRNIVLKLVEIVFTTLPLWTL